MEELIETLFTDTADYDLSFAYDLSDREKGCSYSQPLLSPHNKQDLILTTDKTLREINSAVAGVFPVTTFGGEMQTTTVVENQLVAAPTAPNMESSQLIQEEFMLCKKGVGGFRDLMAISANDPHPPMQLNNSNTGATVSRASMLQNRPQKIVARPLRQERNSAQGSGHSTHYSPVTFQQGNADAESFNMQFFAAAAVKTEQVPVALTPLIHGGESRPESVIASSTTAQCADPSSISSSGKSSKKKTKRIKKWESSDISDPTVRNAKAARMNRDKKKREAEELQAQVDDSTAKKVILEEQLSIERNESERAKAQWKQDIEQRDRMILQLKEELQIERAKNSINVRQKVTMINLIENVVSGIKPTVIYVTDRLATIPMPHPSEMDKIRNQPQQPTPHDCVGSRITFKAFGETITLIDPKNEPSH